MCTAVTYKTKDHYFGRNMDLEFSYHETVTITPREKEFKFLRAGSIKRHPAMIGMAYVVDDYPLYYDATNEYGLSAAGLNFPSNAHYNTPIEWKDNITQYEFIPWILCNCVTVSEAREMLRKINITDDPFSEQLPAAPLHWMIADREEAIVFEQTAAGGKIYDDPVGVMTNNPTFDYQMTHLADYMGCTVEPPSNKIADFVRLEPYSRGMGGIGIPGDLSSASRFIKAVFTRMNSVSDESEDGSITRFFKILGAVEQQKGCCRLGKDKYGKPICEYTIYSSCCNTDRGIYYYTTYGNSQICGVDMHHTDLEGKQLISYELQTKQNVRMLN